MPTQIVFHQMSPKKEEDETNNQKKCQTYRIKQNFS